MTTVNRVLAVLERHQRHIEASPGAGKECQDYALATIGDIRNDVQALASAEQPSFGNKSGPINDKPLGPHMQQAGDVGRDAGYITVVRRSAERLLDACQHVVDEAQRAEKYALNEDSPPQEPPANDEAVRLLEWATTEGHHIVTHDTSSYEGEADFEYQVVRDDGLKVFGSGDTMLQALRSAFLTTHKQEGK